MVLANSMRGPTASASPGATSQRWIRTVDISTTEARINHATVSNGRATRSALGSADALPGDGGTMWVLMMSSIPFSPMLSSTAESMGLRALLAVVLACVALAVIDRFKPATPGRPIPVRVEHKPSPLYKEPERQQRTRAAATLSVGAVLMGTIIACILGFLFTIALELVGGLLRS